MIAALILIVLIVAHMIMGGLWPFNIGGPFARTKR